MTELSNTSSTFKGYIDFASSGFIRGWIFSPESPDSEVEFLLSADGVILGKIVANMFREDLVKVGYGSGRHGFCWKYNFSQNAINGKTLQLLDLARRRIGKPYVVQNDVNGVEVKNSYLSHFLLQFDLLSDKEQIVTFQAFNEGNRFWQGNKKLNSGINKLVIPLSGEVINNQENCLTLGMLGKTEFLWQEKVWILKNCIHLHSESSLDSIHKLNLTPIYDMSNIRKKARLDSINLQRNTSVNIAVDDLEKAFDIVDESIEINKFKGKLNIPQKNSPAVSIILEPNLSLGLYIKTIASIFLSKTNYDSEIILGLNKKSSIWKAISKIAKGIVLVQVDSEMKNLEIIKACIDNISSNRVLFLNNVGEITSYFIDELLEQLDRSPSSAVVGKIINMDGQCVETGIFPKIDKSVELLEAEICKPSLNYLKRIEYFLDSAVGMNADIARTIVSNLEQNSNSSNFYLSLSALIHAKGLDILYVPFAESFILEGHHLEFSKVTMEKVEQTDYLYKECINLLSQDLQKNIDNCTKKRTIIMVDRMIPEPDKDAGSYAAIQEIKLLQSLDFHIVYIPDNFVYSPKYTYRLQEIGVEVLYFPYYSSSTAALQAKLPFAEAIYLTRYHNVEKYYDTIKGFSKNIPIIFNNADLHFLREIRYASSLGDEALLKKAEITRKREIAVMKKVDAILSYSEYEHAVITSHILRSDIIHICPWVLDKKESCLGYSEREGISFLGGYEHTSNIEAFEFFVIKVMPLLSKKYPELKVYFYGSYMPDSFKKYENENIILKGYVKSLDEVFQNHRVFIAPLLSGAGVKGKVLESVAYSLPCVLSPIAIEATGLIHNMSALVAESPDSWVRNIADIYFNEVKWSSISEQQKILAKEVYSFDRGQEKMRNILASVNID